MLRLCWQTPDQVKMQVWRTVSSPDADVRHDSGNHVFHLSVLLQV